MNTCDKCVCIHDAQKEGKISKPCECGCHSASTTVPFIPYIPTCTCNYNTFSPCSIHGYPYDGSFTYQPDIIILSGSIDPDSPGGINSIPPY